MFKTLKLSFLVSLLCYLVMQLYPNFLFTYSHTVGQLTIYSRSPLPEQTEQQLQNCLSKAQKLEHFPETGNYKLFICNSKPLFKFFVPLNKDTYAATLFSNSILIASADISNNTVSAYSSTYGERELTSAIVHELTHVYLRRHFGYIKELSMQEWLLEGYCDYISENFTMEPLKGDTLLRQGVIDDNNQPYTFFRWKKMVKYLIEEQHQTIEQLIENPPDEFKTFSQLGRVMAPSQ